MTEVVCEDGSARRLGAVLDQWGVETLLLVTGQSSFRDSGAGRRLEGALATRRITTFSGFAPNPRLEDLEIGASRIRDVRPDAVLAVGGGSVIDMAKLLALVCGSNSGVREAIEEPTAVTQIPPIVALPTTAGSGSEMTHFAVLYVDGRKRSIAHPAMRPRYALVDPELTWSMPPPLTAVTGLDCLAHAMESMWSVRASASSYETARSALALAWTALPKAVSEPSPSHRREMAHAANLAGKAIDVSRTTLCHALSYPMTWEFGVPHGHAVALTLGEVLLFNSRATEADVVHPGGVERLRRITADINETLGVESPGEGAEAVRSLVRRLGLGTSLSEVGITTVGDRERVSGSVDAQRAANNPRRVDGLAVARILEAVA